MNPNSTSSTKSQLEGVLVLRAEPAAQTLGLVVLKGVVSRDVAGRMADSHCADAREHTSVCMTLCLI